MAYILEGIEPNDPSFILKVMSLTAGLSSVLFVFGLLAGYFNKKPTVIQSSSKDKSFEEKSKAAESAHKKKVAEAEQALETERKERIRLENDLHTAKQSIIELKNTISELKPKIEKINPEEAAEKEQQIKEIESLRKMHEQLQHDLSLRKSRIADLLAEIAMAQTEAEQARAEVHELKSSMAEPQRLNLQLAKDDASLKDILLSVSALEGIQMALLADDYGMVVETAGKNKLPADKLAAVSSLLAQIGNNVEDIFSMGKVKTVSLGDESGFVLDNIYFDLFNLRCALTIARDANHSYPGLADQTIEAIIDRLK